jgi:hypothetical protein
MTYNQENNFRSIYRGYVIQQTRKDDYIVRSMANWEQGRFLTEAEALALVDLKCSEYEHRQQLSDKEISAQILFDATINRTVQIEWQNFRNSSYEWVRRTAKNAAAHDRANVRSGFVLGQGYSSDKKITSQERMENESADRGYIYNTIMLPFDAKFKSARRNHDAKLYLELCAQARALMTKYAWCALM